MSEEALRHVPLFASLPGNEIELLASTLISREEEAGTMLFREGEREGRCYILLEGEVEIIKALGSGDERLLAVRGPGSTLGEMSLFSKEHVRTASVRAKTRLKVLEMRQEDLDSLLHRQPGLAYELVRTLSKRLEESEDHTILDLREKNRLLQEAYDELKAAQAQIIEKEKLEKELEVARQIQLGMLPRALPQHTRLDFAARIVPTSAVGGDFYDVINLGDDRLGLAVGDVTGHGVPAALLMASTVTLLRATAERIDSPSEVLRSVNRHLLAVNDTGLFVTVLYGVLSGSGDEFVYARAGHPLPLVLDAKRNPMALDQGTGQPLGLFDELLLDEGKLTLPDGGLMMLYTDGVTEAADAQGEFFGTERLEAALRLDTGRAEQACEAVWQAVQTYQGGVPQDDDVTLVAVAANRTRHA